MRILVAGAGAMGSVMGALLAKAGNHVTLYDVRTDHMAAVARDGLTLESHEGEEERVPLQATSDPRQLDTADLVLVMCKAWATTAAAEHIAHVVGPDTWVATAQNGLGNDEQLRKVFGPDRVLGGTTTVGATQRRPGQAAMSATVGTGSSITQFGPDREGADVVATVLSAAGMPAEVLADLDAVIWTKLAMAAPAGSLSAVLRCTIADLLASDSAMDLLDRLFGEVVDVAAADGVALDRTVVREHAMSTYRTVGPHVSSMAADVMAGRRTENEAMCLEVSRRGERLGVPVPVATTVGRLIHSLDGS